VAARFFCDNCGARVDRNTRCCPQCGCYFEFVRCPQCGFTGEEKLFSKGCPDCGYCAGKTNDQQQQKKAPKQPLPPFGKLPLWVYVVALLVLLLVALLLFLR